jgi:hypothetical protein
MLSFSFLTYHRHFRVSGQIRELEAAALCFTTTFNHNAHWMPGLETAFQNLFIHATTGENELLIAITIRVVFTTQ